MLTPKQTQEAARISASTLRRYVKKFRRHLSPTATKTRARRFSNEDLAIILQIKELYRDGYNDGQIDKQLGLVEPGRADVSELAILYPGIAEPLKEALDLARSTGAGLEHVKQQQDQAAAQLDRQAGEIARLRRQQQAALWIIGIAIFVILLLVLLTS